MLPVFPACPSWCTEEIGRHELNQVDVGGRLVVTVCHWADDVRIPGGGVIVLQGEADSDGRWTFSATIDDTNGTVLKTGRQADLVASAFITATSWLDQREAETRA